MRATGECLLIVINLGGELCRGFKSNDVKYGWWSENLSIRISGDVVKPGASVNSRLIDMISENFFTNVLTNTTRQGRVLDIFLTNNSSLIKSVLVIPGLSAHDLCC